MLLIQEEVPFRVLLQGSKKGLLNRKAGTEGSKADTMLYTLNIPYSKVCDEDVSGLET